ALPEHVELVAGENRRTSTPKLAYPGRPAWDPVAGRLLFLGGSKLHAVDPETGVVTVIADNQGIGSGPTFSSSAHLFMDPDDANSVFALAVDPSSSRLLRIDLTSGDRSELMDLRAQEPIIN